MFQRNHLPISTIMILAILLTRLLGIHAQNQSELLDIKPQSSTLIETKSLKDLGYTKDETVHGVLVDRTYTVNWPDAWKPQPGSSFTLEFSHSPILEAYSSLAVDWNGVRLASVLLTPENIDHGQLIIEIPEGQIVRRCRPLSIESSAGRRPSCQMQRWDGGQYAG